MKLDLYSTKKKSAVPVGRALFVRTIYESQMEQLLRAVVNFRDEKIPVGICGLNLHHIILSTIHDRVQLRLDLGCFLVPVTLVARDEQYAKTIAVSSTGSIVGNFGRSEISIRVRCLHGGDVILTTVDRRLEFGTYLILFLVPVTLVARDR